MKDRAVYHKPEGDPCSRCGQPAIRHRVRHPPDGDPCSCGLPLKNHRTRAKGEKRSGSKVAPLFMGIDGEGQGRDPHKYYLLCASDKTGKHVAGIERAEGLSTIECLEFMLNLPKRARVFAYSFNYDWTKIFKDLPAEALYKLVRPDKRRTPEGKLRAIRWNGYRLNMLSTKCTIEHLATGRRRVIWDIWKFFQGKFVTALSNWGIKTNFEAMTAMKEKRSEFDKVDAAAIRDYCFEECRCLAELIEKLIAAHTNAGLKLRAFFGAGSTASALLDRYDIKERRGSTPREMEMAIASAFFGGRFEHTVVGPIPGPVYSYDISSAYPYQLCFLPCLEHARWSLTNKYHRMIGARHACVRYKLRSNNSPDVWGPFPYRLLDGSIIFPGVSGGGWIWRDEYLMGEHLFPNIEFCEAWILESDCDCGSPFKDIPSTYKTRLALGKDAAGIVLKLGMNSVYGKLAQSSGSAPYQSWVWAGMVTSGTRAQILEFLGLHTDPRNMLMVATDGVYTRERIKTPAPLDTGTFDAPKPLGGWEEKVLENGIFAARPGIYFPNAPSEADIAAFRARGLSKSVLVKEHRMIVDGWQQGKSEVTIPSVTRFVGMKSGTICTPKGEYRRTESCGEWVEREIKLTFDAMPKRASTEGQYMTIRNLTTSEQSFPYKGILSPEALEMKTNQLEAEEQPDGGDFTDYD